MKFLNRDIRLNENADPWEINLIVDSDILFLSFRIAVIRILTLSILGNLFYNFDLKMITP